MPPGGVFQVTISVTALTTARMEKMKAIAQLAHWSSLTVGVLAAPVITAPVITAAIVTSAFISYRCVMVTMTVMMALMKICVNRVQATTQGYCSLLFYLLIISLSQSYSHVA